MCLPWGMNKTKRGPAPKSFLSGRQGAAPSQEGCRWGVGFLDAEARGCVGWLAMGWTDTWVTAPPCTRCCSGPTIGGRRWETVLQWERGNTGPAPSRHPVQSEMHLAPGSASELVSPMGFDVSASPTWMPHTQQHRSSAKKVCCIYGRLTLELRCLTYSSTAIWRCCWGFCARHFVSPQVAAQHPWQQVLQRVLALHPPAAAPGMGWCARLHPALGGTALALPRPALSDILLHLRKHNWEKMFYEASLFLMHSIQCKQEYDSCRPKKRPCKSFEAFFPSTFFSRRKALYSVKVRGPCWTKWQTVPTLGHLKSNAAMTINEWESRGRKWLTVQKECERKANGNENGTRTSTG